MSSAEAQARVLAAIAARAYSDEQTQHVLAYSYGRDAQHTRRCSRARVAET